MGKMMGGSGAHNSLLYNQGNSRDFDTWAELTGDTTWNSTNVLPIFKRLENYHGPFSGGGRGKMGPLPIQTGNSSILAAYKLAAKELGYKYGSPNGPQREGFSPPEYLKTKEGRAVSTCTIFIDPILGIRKQLTVLTYAEVTKVLLKKNVAFGVEYSRFGKKLKATARKEVIISAGVFSTPLLLFLSGIGPAEMLSKAKIKIVADLPVGNNLQGHKVVGLSATFRFPMETLYQNLTPANFDVFLKGKADPLLSQSDVRAQAFFVSTFARNNGEMHWPDIHFEWSESFVGSDGKIYDAVFLISVARPKSRGTVKLNTKAYLRGERRSTRLALVDYQIFENEEDRLRLIEGIKIVLKIFETKALKKLGMKVMPHTKCLETNLLDSDEYWTCVIKNFGATVLHPVGTCRMGPGSTDPFSVVDSTFRVNGVQNLRVIDASVFPKNTNANTNAPTIVVAEKGASTVLREHTPSF